jgi:cytochrome c553
MKSALFGACLFVLATLAACGDTSPPDEHASPATSDVSSLPHPADVLAALPPESQPYGLDVYTAKCVACHGDLGQGIGTNPALKGLTRVAMQQKLQDYRAGKTLGAQSAVMSQAASGLSDAEIAAVSIYAGE